VSAAFLPLYTHLTLISSSNLGAADVAGKTTLLDVLAGRKNTGVARGDIFVNNHPKNEKSFRRLMGYVEQFDSLAPHDTAREAIEFSAAMRL
jgi:ABC-type multidrug transport system ATPase subunit